jgi:hypothetical protein
VSPLTPLAMILSLDIPFPLLKSLFLTIPFGVLNDFLIGGIDDRVGKGFDVCLN